MVGWCSMGTFNDPWKKQMPRNLIRHTTLFWGIFWCLGGAMKPWCLHWWNPFGTGNKQVLAAMMGVQTNLCNWFLLRNLWTFETISKNANSTLREIQVGRELCQRKDFFCSVQTPSQLRFFLILCVLGIIMVHLVILFEWSRWSQRLQHECRPLRVI